eukprot:7123539-Lingulodinium_polyedra.AAC.1
MWAARRRPAICAFLVERDSPFRVTRASVFRCRGCRGCWVCQGKGMVGEGALFVASIVPTGPRGPHRSEGPHL